MRSILFFAFLVISPSVVAVFGPHSTPVRADDVLPFERVAPVRLKAGDPIPAPKGKIVLRVEGASSGEAGKPLAFDIPTLELMGLIRFTNTNRWYTEPVTFEGVLGSDFLAAVGVPPGAKTMHMVALNDYVADVPIEDLRLWPVMLALKIDGKYMSVREKGPIWLVYPSHIDEKLGEPAYQGRWIWQVKDIRFK